MSNRLRACCYHIAHLHIDNVPNDQPVQLRFARVRIACEHGAMASAPDFVFFQSFRAQNFEIDRIIQIMTVIRDLIREIRDLRLQRWTKVFLQRGAGFQLRGLVSQVRTLPHLLRHFIRRLVFSQTFPHFKCQIEARKTWIRIFEQLHHPQTLAVVIEPTVITHTFRQHLFS